MTEQSPQREEYQAKVKAQLEKINAQLDELKAKAAQTEADVKTDYHSRMEELYAKRDAAGAKLEELQKAGSDAWEEVQKGFETAWSDLTSAFENASKKFDQ